jgi:hypothetical protein
MCGGDMSISQTIKRKKMNEQEQAQVKMQEMMAANTSKGQLIEKMVFAGLPILFSCVVYLMSALSSANNEIIQLKSKMAVVVNADNKAIPPQGTTIDMAQIREHLNEKIDKVEREAALARAAMTLDREKSLAANQKITLEMQADAAQARAAIRSEATIGRQQLREELGDKIDKAVTEAALARSILDKRLSLIEQDIQYIKAAKGK